MMITTNRTGLALLGAAACAPLSIVGVASAQTAFEPIADAPSFVFVAGADGDAVCTLGLLDASGALVPSFAEDAPIVPLTTLDLPGRVGPSFGNLGSDAGASAATVPSPGTGLVGVLGFAGLLGRRRRGA